MLPLLALGALLAFGLAGKKKAQAQALPATVKPATTVSIITPAARRLAARRAAIKAKRSRVQKILASKIKKITARPITPQAHTTLGNLILMAANKKIPAVARRAAAKEVKKIIAKPATQRAAAINRLPQQAKIALAKAVIRAETTTKPTASDAAKMLREWTKQGGNQGTRNNRSATVKKYQLLMGFKGAAADGIIGPKTRARAKQLGYTLYSRSRQKPGAVGWWPGMTESLVYDQLTLDNLPTHAG